MEPGPNPAHPPLEPGAIKTARSMEDLSIPTRTMLAVGAIATLLQSVFMILQAFNQLMYGETEPTWMRELSANFYVSWLLIALAFAAYLQPTRSAFALTASRVGLVVGVAATSGAVQVASAYLPGNPSVWAAQTAFWWVPVIATFAIARMVAVRTHDRTTRIWADIAFLAVLLTMAWSIFVYSAWSRLPKVFVLPVEMGSKLAIVLGVPPIVSSILLSRKLLASIKHH